MERKRGEERKDKGSEALASGAAKGLNGKVSAPGILSRRLKKKKKKTMPTKNDPIRRYSQLGPRPMHSSRSWFITPPTFHLLAWVSGKKKSPNEVDRTRPIVERNAYAVSLGGDRKIYRNNHPFKT
jgi:hypothetical protein